MATIYLVEPTSGSKAFVPSGSEGSYLSKGWVQVSREQYKQQRAGVPLTTTPVATAPITPAQVQAALQGASKATQATIEAQMSPPTTLAITSPTTPVLVQQAQAAAQAARAAVELAKREGVRIPAETATLLARESKIDWKNLRDARFKIEASGSITYSGIENLVTNFGVDIATQTLSDMGFEDARKLTSDAQRRIDIQRQYAEFINPSGVLQVSDLVASYDGKSMPFDSIVKDLHSLGYTGVTTEDLRKEHEERAWQANTPPEEKFHVYVERKEFPEGALYAGRDPNDKTQPMYYETTPAQLQAIEQQLLSDSSRAPTYFYNLLIRAGIRAQDVPVDMTDKEWEAVQEQAGESGTIIKGGREAANLWHKWKSLSTEDRQKVLGIYYYQSTVEEGRVTPVSLPQTGLMLLGAASEETRKRTIKAAREYLPEHMQTTVIAGVAAATTIGEMAAILPLAISEVALDPNFIKDMAIGMKDFTVDAARGTARGDPWAIGQMAAIVGTLYLGGKPLVRTVRTRVIPPLASELGTRMQKFTTMIKDSTLSRMTGETLPFASREIASVVQGERLLGRFDYYTRVGDPMPQILKGLVTTARQEGLRISSTTHIFADGTKVKGYYYYKPTRTGIRQARLYDKLSESIEAKGGLNNMSLGEQVRAHARTGELLGYSKWDIAHWLQERFGVENVKSHAPRYALKLPTRTNLADILQAKLSELDAAIRGRSVTAIRKVATELKAIGSRIGGSEGAIVTRLGKNAESQAKNLSTMSVETLDNIKISLENAGIKSASSTARLEALSLQGEILELRLKIAELLNRAERAAGKEAARLRAEATRLAKEATRLEGEITRLHKEALAEEAGVYGETLEQRFQRAMEQQTTKKATALKPEELDMSIAEFSEFLEWKLNNPKGTVAQFRKARGQKFDSLLKEIRESGEELATKEKASQIVPLEQWAEIMREATKQAKEIKAAQELRIQKATEESKALRRRAEEAEIASKAKEIARKLKRREAEAKKAARTTLERLRKTQDETIIAKLLQGLTEAELLALLAVDSGTVLRALAKLGTKQAAKVTEKLDTKRATELKDAVLVQAKIDTKTATQTDLKTQTKTEQELKDKTLVDLRLQLQEDLTLDTEVVVPTPTPTTTEPIPTEPVTKNGKKNGKPRRFIVPPLPSLSTSAGKKALVLKGAAGWKQGFIYKYVIPIRDKKTVKILHTRKPIKGIPIVEGPDSAYKSITRLGLYFPKEVLIDMGIMDVQILKGGKKLKFIRDPKQKTKTNKIVVGEPTLTVSR